MVHVRNEIRREQFVMAAIKVIENHGIADATTRRIAAEAHAPLASLHYCFRNKEELFEAVAQSLGQKAKAQMSARVSPGMGLVNGAEAVLRALADYATENFAHQLTELEFHIWNIRAKRSEVPANIYREWLIAVRSLLETAKRDDEPEQDLDALASLILALTDGYILQDQMLQNMRLLQSLEVAVSVVTGALQAGMLGRPHVGA